MKELKIIFGYSKYGVTKDGEVWSFKSNQLLKPQPRGAYLKVTLVNDKGQRKQLSIHRLVAEMFCDNPENKTYVNHINGVKHDNRSSNLEWVTASENINHAYSEGLLVHYTKELGEKEKLVLDMLTQRRPHKEIAIATGYSKSFISQINQGIRWKEEAKLYGFVPQATKGRGSWKRN